MLIYEPPAHGVLEVAISFMLIYAAAGSWRAVLHNSGRPTQQRSAGHPSAPSCQERTLGTLAPGTATGAYIRVPGQAWQFYPPGFTDR